MMTADSFAPAHRYFENEKQNEIKRQNSRKK